MSEDFYLTLTEILRDLFLRDDLIATPELAAADVPGWDSFKQIEIILAVEQHYGVRLSSSEIDSLHQLGDLARIVVRSGSPE